MYYKHQIVILVDIKSKGFGLYFNIEDENEPQRNNS